jgi:putative PIN family toxin of toxin-antitoxin system
MWQPRPVIRIVLDTSIVVTAFRSRTGAGNALLGAAAMGQVTPLASVPLFLEYEAVLKRPEQRQVIGFTLADVDDLLAELAKLVEPVVIHFRWRPQLTDPADELVLEAAVNGRADALVTYNRKDFAAADRFGLPVLLPADVLKRGRQ